MSKRKSTNPALAFDDVLNDRNDWLSEENGENDEIGDNLDELCGEEEEIDSKPSEECSKEEQYSKEPEENVNRQQRYENKNRQQKSRNRNVHDIDSSLNGSNQKEITNMNKNYVLEESCGYLRPRKDRNTKKIWRS